MARIASVPVACIAAVIVAALGLGGCGGGGDDDGGNVLGAAPEAVINSDSAPVIAQAVASAVAGSDGLGDLGGIAVPAAPTGFVSVGKDVPQVLAATLGPKTLECAISGSATLSGTQAVPDSVTVGDTLIFLFSDCDDGDGSLADGLLEFEIVAFSGDIATGAITLTVSMTLESLRFGIEAFDGSMNGDLSLTIDTTNVPETFVAISSTRFSIESPTRAMTLTDFIVTMQLDPMLDSVTLDSSATVSSALFDGEVSYVTTQSLIFSGDGAAESGVIVVTGAAGATLRIEFLGADLVELEIDVDGNGTVDDVIMTSWTALLD